MLAHGLQVRPPASLPIPAHMALDSGGREWAMVALWWSASGSIAAPAVTRAPVTMPMGLCPTGPCRGPGRAAGPGLFRRAGSGPRDAGGQGNPGGGAAGCVVGSHHGGRASFHIGRIGFFP